MKTLQNFTTPEQSKRLLELGLPADSADLYYHKLGQLDEYSLNILDAPYSDIEVKEYKNMYIPCWSVGRLIEIWQLCMGSDYIIYNDDNLTETLIDNITGAIANNYMDFSILED